MYLLRTHTRTRKGSHRTGSFLCFSPDIARANRGVPPLITAPHGRLPIISSLYGAMLAGADYVLMGAGIPMVRFSVWGAVMNV